MQRAVVAGERIREHRIGRMQEQRDAELLDARVERLKPLGVDARIGADRARHVDAHQAEPADGIVEHLDRDPRIDERHRRARPQAAGVFLLRARHLLVPVGGGLAAFLARQVGEEHRERAD